MIKRVALAACLILVISSCGKLPLTPLPLENIQSTSTVPLSPMPAKPAATPMVLLAITPPPTFTPPPGFSPNGPFLAFADDPDHPSRITLFDPLQSASFVISRPVGDILQWSAAGLSPDGQYIAYYTGHLDTLTDLSAAPPAPQSIELNIMRTSDGSIVFQKSLLNKDYPRVFLQAADSLLANPPQDPGYQGFSSRDGLAASLQAAFADFIYTNSWSPDGLLLAFASGSDGPSSDVYTYNLTSGAVTRITSGPSEVYKLVWSSDSHWILNSGIYYVGEGMCGTWFISSADGSGSSGFSVKGALGNDLVRGCDFDGWVSDSQALVSEDANGRGIFNLEVLDIRQKTIDLIWPHNFHSYAFDPIARQAYISTSGETLRDGTFFQQGTYKVDVASHATVSIASDMQSLLYLGWGSGQTIAGIPLNSLDICFLPSGSCSGFPDTGQKQSSGLSVSAGRNNLALYSDSGLWNIFPDSAGQTARRVYTGPVASVIWNPDSGANPSSSLALLQSNNSSMVWNLYDPVTSLTKPLPDFTGSYFQGWFFRN